MNEPTNIIEFLHGDGGAVPTPTTAVRVLPQWVKTMPAEFPNPASNDEPASTVKRCAPFVDAMSCGYVLPLACDVRFHLLETGLLHFEQDGPVVESQQHGGFRDTPFGHLLVVKFQNPWIVKTPSGYSTLFVSLLNQSTMPFQILAGLVETDNYYNQISFPSICMMRPGDRFALAKGTPLVQAIPIRRENWEAKVSPWDLQKVTAQISAIRANPHVYKDEIWIRKSYR